MIAAATAVLFLVGCFCGYIAGAWVRPGERIPYGVALVVVALAILAFGL